MKNKTIISMLCITAMVITALFLGYNGLILAGACTLIAGLGGFVIGKKQS